MKWLQNVKAALDAQDPSYWWLIIFGLTVMITAIIKWKAPTFWAKLPGRVQAIPAALIAALPNALASGSDPKQVFKNAIFGAIMGGAGAIGVYHVLKGPKVPETAKPSNDNDGDDDDGGGDGGERTDKANTSGGGDGLGQAA
jgi:hypothetical protein